jgi:hypothetical protein
VPPLAEAAAYRNRILRALVGTLSPSGEKEWVIPQLCLACAGPPMTRVAT